MNGMTPEHEWENYVVLMTIQGFAGLITPAISGISVQVDGDDITVYVAITDSSPIVLEDIDDALGDMEADLMPRAVNIKAQIFRGSAYDGWEGRQQRLVFLTKYHGDEYNED